MNSHFEQYKTGLKVGLGKSAIQPACSFTAFPCEKGI